MLLKVNCSWSVAAKLTATYNNQFQIPGYYYTSKSTTMLIIYAFMNLEVKITVTNCYKVNTNHMKLNVSNVINVSIWLICWQYLRVVQKIVCLKWDLSKENNKTYRYLIQAKQNATLLAKTIFL